MSAKKGFLFRRKRLVFCMKMVYEDIVKRLSPTLRRITYKLNGHFSFFDDDDLYQEALANLWVLFRKDELSDKTDSFILQGCFYHLKNYIRKAMDRADIISLNGNIGEDETTLEEIFALEDSRPRDDLETRLLEDEVLSNGLTEREKKIVLLSLEGFTVREIGQRLGISHVRVIKLKGRIKKK